MWEGFPPSSRDRLSLRKDGMEGPFFVTKMFYRQSPTYERVPFQECVCKSNLFVNPTKLA